MRRTYQEEPPRLADSPSRSFDNSLRKKNYVPKMLTRPMKSSDPSVDLTVITKVFKGFVASIGSKQHDFFESDAAKTLIARMLLVKKTSSVKNPYLGNCLRRRRTTRKQRFLLTTTFSHLQPSCCCSREMHCGYYSAIPTAKTASPLSWHFNK